MSDLKDALIALDLKPTSIVFFDSNAIDGRRLADLHLDVDFSVPCIPVVVPRGKTLQECVRDLDFETVKELVTSAT
jgi:hypothetical protein